MCRRMFVWLLLCLPLMCMTAHAGESEDVKASDIVFGHIGDLYEWHIADIGGVSLHIPLPIVVCSSTGWHVFLSSRLHHGEVYEGLYIASGGDYEGKIVERSVDGTERRPLDLSITKNVLGLMINGALLVWIMMSCARWYKRRELTDAVPKGGRGIVETIVMFVYQQVIKDCVGSDHRRYAPYLLTVFFFILVNNLMGIVPIFPGGANTTGNIAVTMVLALCTFVFVNVFGTKDYWKDILWPHVPMWMKCPVPLMPVIELFGIFTKPFTLMIRLFANIMAGHVVILSLVSLIFVTVKAGPAINGTMTVVAVVFTIFMDFLELLVAFIQAYVFTLLSAVFIGMSRMREKADGE